MCYLLVPSVDTDKFAAACALRPDLELLANGDETLVGEKGAFSAHMA
jgi:hypothetical protein